MSPQENQLLQSFLQQLIQVKSLSQDPEVAALIASASAQQPDAVYLLVQRALLQDQAMKAAQQQIAQLQEELASSKAAPSSFFGNSAAWGNSVASRPAATAVPNPPAALALHNASSPAASSFFGGNAGSMLGTVAATAAGVAAGAFLFQGLGKLMDGGNHASLATAAAPLAQDSGLIPNSFADDSNTLADASDSSDTSGSDAFDDFSQE